MATSGSKPEPPFEIVKYLESIGVRRNTMFYRKGHIIFAQGDECRTVMYLRVGAVKITVNSSTGKEAVIAILQAGAFFGEACIAGEPVRVATATAMESVSILEIEKSEMIRVIHGEPEFADHFVSYILKRNGRIEEDLIDQLFNSCEKRLARALLLIARYGNEEKSEKGTVKVSQQVLAEMVGTTRGRISFFMNKFRKLGFIEYNDGLHVNDSLLRVLIHD